MRCKLQARSVQAAQQWRSPSSRAATRPPQHSENLLRAYSGVTQARISGGRTPRTGPNLASCAASGGMKLVTFGVHGCDVAEDGGGCADVDGTLIHSVGDEANKLHKLAFKQAWKEVFGIDTHIDIIKHHGGTDPLILLKILECHGVATSEGMQKLEQMQQSMVNYCTDHKSDAGQGLALLPGVVEALEELKKKGVAVALVTGNLEPIGWLKMEALGIKPLFTQPCFGGFGSDFCSGNTQEMWHDRAELIRIAAKKAAQLLGEEPSQCYHVGDTPMDVQAAVDAGAVPIGVTTGVFSAQELLDAAPGARILTSMASKEDVLKALDLEQ